MAKFRKRTVVVEAEVYDGSEDSIARIAKLGDGILIYHNHLGVPTLEGQHRADIGDWIIKGVKGELYPCKPDIFLMTYEHVSS